jgi:hypothetical protein
MLNKDSKESSKMNTKNFVGLFYRNREDETVNDNQETREGLLNSLLVFERPKKTPSSVVSSA